MNNFENYSIKEIVDKARENEEVKKVLYSRLYYKVEKQLKDYEGKNYEQARKVAENILKQAIEKYISSNFSYDIFHYIDNQFQRFEKKIFEDLNFSRLKTKAYHGDNAARKKLFMIYKKTLDSKLDILEEKIKSVYYKYLVLDMKRKNDFSYLDKNFEFVIPNSIYDKDNMYQEYYLYTWKVLNEFYTGKYQTAFFSTYINNKLSYRLDVELGKITKEIIAYFKYPETFIEVDLLHKQDYFIKGNNDMELKDAMKVIESYLTKKEKKYWDSIKEKYLFQGSNVSDKTPRSTTYLRKAQIKQIIKKEKISIWE